MNKTPTLFLVDGSSYLFRAYHALPALANAKGQPTGALYGVTNMLRRLMDEHNPEHIAVIFDAKGKNFRHRMFADYKANRPPMPDDLRQQIEPLHQLVQAMGLPLLIVPDVEADDVIGTLVAQARAKGWSCFISASDKDLAQLVDEQVLLVDTMSNTRFDIPMVEKKFGVKPEQIIDYLALMGDTSDNIPGVPGVGPKTAAKWLGQYGDLDGLIAAADQIKGKVGEKLRAALDQLPLSRALATVKLDVELPCELETLTYKAPDSEQLLAMLKEFGFSAWLKALGTEEGQEETGSDSSSTAEAEYHTVRELKELTSLVEALKEQDAIVFDLETTSLNTNDAEIVGIAIAYRSNEGFYIPVAHVGEDAEPQIALTKAMEQLAPIFAADKPLKIGQNLKYDLSVLTRHGYTLNGIAHDTMLESYVYNSTASRHDMDSLARFYLQRETIHYEDVAGKGAKQLTFDQVPVATASRYAAEDAEVTLALHETLLPKLNEEAQLLRVYRDLEVPLISVLSRMEQAGVLVDKDRLAKQSEEIALRLESLKSKAWELAGREFNLASTKQLGEILFQDLGLPIIAKTPKGAPSTSEDVMHELARQHDLPRCILEHRSLAKLKNTYTDKLQDQVHPRTGRVHTSYHQAVAGTGRLSSSDPNLQNIPIRTEEGRRIRQAFIAPESSVLLACDYSQIELRIMAHLSSDPGLLSAFKQGIDVHSATAAEVFGVTPNEVNKNQRRAAKAINFGLMYGMSAFGLSKQLEIPRDQAQEYMNIYFERYPGVRAYMDETRVTAKQQGYVETLFGRRLWLPDLNSRNGARRQGAERAAINAPMQGTAADIIKRAMIEVDRWLQQQNNGAVLILQVHDELVLEVPEGILEEVKAAVIKRMADAAELAIPLVVDAGVGKDWDTAH